VVPVLIRGEDGLKEREGEEEARDTHHTLHSAHRIMGEPSSPLLHVQCAAALPGFDFADSFLFAAEDLTVEAGVAAVSIFSFSDGSTAAGVGGGCSCLTVAGVVAVLRLLLVGVGLAGV
jgi:hypothetical protein